MDHKLKKSLVSSFNPRPDWGGGRNATPSAFLPIAKKRKEISLPNFAKGRPGLLGPVFA